MLFGIWLTACCFLSVLSLDSQSCHLLRAWLPEHCSFTWKSDKMNSSLIVYKLHVWSVWCPAELHNLPIACECLHGFIVTSAFQSCPVWSFSLWHLGESKELSKELPQECVGCSELSGLDSSKVNGGPVAHQTSLLLFFPVWFRDCYSWKGFFFLAVPKPLWGVCCSFNLLLGFPIPCWHVGSGSVAA